MGCDKIMENNNPSTLNVDPITLITNGYQIKANAENLKLKIKAIKDRIEKNLSSAISSYDINGSVTNALNSMMEEANEILEKVYGMANYIHSEVAYIYDELDESIASQFNDLGDTSNFDLVGHYYSDPPQDNR